MKQTCPLIAPYFFFGSMLFGVLTTASLVEAFWPMAVIGLSGFIYTFRRSLKWLQISAKHLKFRNAFGWTLLVINSSSDVENLRLSKKSDQELQGPKISENTTSKRALGRVLSLFEFVFFPVAVSSSIATEDFLILTCDDRRVSKRVRIILPDVYGWNKKPYKQMREWFQQRGVILAVDGEIEWSDESAAFTGYVYIATATFTFVILAVAYFLC